jgi:hypothetical protein
MTVALAQIFDGFRIVQKDLDNICGDFTLR